MVDSRRAAGAIAAAGASVAGSWTSKRAPRPVPSLKAVIVPPCASTMPFAIARPRPSPPADDAPRALIERSKERVPRLGIEADARVGDRELRPVGSGVAGGDGDASPPRCVVDRVADEIPYDLAEPQWIGVHPMVSAQVERARDSGRVALRLQRIHDLFDGGVQVDDLELQSRACSA